MDGGRCRRYSWTVLKHYEIIIILCNIVHIIKSIVILCSLSLFNYFHLLLIVTDREFVLGGVLHKHVMLLVKGTREGHACDSHFCYIHTN